MGQVMHIDQIVKRIESLIVQVEGLRFTKKVLMAAKLHGHIEEALEIGGVSWTETWRKRVDRALADVNIDEPKAKLVDDSGLVGLGVVPVTPGMKPPQL